MSASPEVRAPCRVSSQRPYTGRLLPIRFLGPTPNLKTQSLWNRDRADGTQASAHPRQPSTTLTRGSGRKKGPRRNSYDPWSQVKDLLPLRRQGCGLSAQVGPTCGLLASTYLPGHLELPPQAPKDPCPGYEENRCLGIRKTGEWGMGCGIGRPRTTWGAFSDSEGKGERNRSGSGPKESRPKSVRECTEEFLSL